VPPWDEVENKDEEDLKMAVYAAMIDRLDQNIGRILDKLKQMSAFENTLIMFLSDNGGCPYKRNKSDIPPGPRESYRTYDTPWANVSNTPFRMYKRYNHEGGNSTPFIAHWPKMIKNKGAISHQVGHIIDIMATCIDAADTPYPTLYEERTILPLEGKSLLPVFQGLQREGHAMLFWQFNKHLAVREGKWKLVSKDGKPWELYDIEADRTELNDLANTLPDKVLHLENLYNSWVKKSYSKVQTGNKDPSEFGLFQNFPNPFNSQTTLQFALPRTEHVTLSVFNDTGQLVYTLVNERKSNGYHSVIWDASEMSSGIYMVQLNAESFSETRQCVILK
jgi:arylsulfatase